jgi:hypothetical protein
MPSTASYRRVTQESIPFERCFRTAKAGCRPGLADGRMEKESLQPASCQGPSLPISIGCLAERKLPTRYSHAIMRRLHADLDDCFVASRWQDRLKRKATQHRINT